MDIIAEVSILTHVLEAFTRAKGLAHDQALPGNKETYQLLNNSSIRLVGEINTRLNTLNNMEISEPVVKETEFVIRKPIFD